MLFWPSSCTTCPMMGSLVRAFFSPSTRYYMYTCRGAPHRFSQTYWGAFGWEHGRCCLENIGTVPACWKDMCIIALWCILLTCSQIIAIVMDNASNNNMLIKSLKSQCQRRGISFSAQDAHMRCMPHTIHLAAIKVCNICFLFIPDHI